MDYKKFYDEVGGRIGWDFSKVKKTEDGKRWEFYDEVLKVAKPSDRILDIGTGGGERVLKIANKAHSLVGIDNSKSMIKTAIKNLKKSGVSNVEFRQMDASSLDFSDNSFDVISCRHSAFDAVEMYKVLKTGGYFVTQQVGESDKLNIKEAFNRGQFQGKRDGALMNRYVQDLKEAGFKNIRTDQYNSTEYYNTPEDLIFLLKHTPIIPSFGKNKTDFELLDKFIKEYSTPKGIKTNSKRFMITARK